MVPDCGDRGLFSIWTCSFWVKSIISVLLVTTKWKGDYFEIRRCGANCSVRFSSLFNVFFWIFHYFIQHSFTCCPSDSTVSTTALAVRRSNHSARSDPHIILLFVLIHYIGAPKPSCANGDAEQSCSANYERYLNSRIFSCSDRFSFYATNIPCANKLTRYK